MNGVKGASIFFFTEGQPWGTLRISDQKAVLLYKVVGDSSLPVKLLRLHPICLFTSQKTPDKHTKFEDSLFSTYFATYHSLFIKRKIIIKVQYIPFTWPVYLQ